jgi:hypothetical protein
MEIKMDDKTKIGIIVASVIFVIIVVGAIATWHLPKADGVKPLASYDTTCTGSISADISKIERVPGSATFKVVATANRGGDCLKIAWTKDDINKYLKVDSPEEMVDKGVYSDIILNSMTERFFTSYDKDSVGGIRKVKKYNFYDHGWTIYSCSVSNCRNDWGYPTTKYAIRSVSWPGPCACVYESDYGTFAPFSGVKSRNGQATIKVSGFSDVSFSFGADSGGTVNAANGKMSISWRGDLLGGRWVGTPGSPYIGFEEGNSYRITDSSYNILGPDKVQIYANGKYWNNLEECIGKYDQWILGNVGDAKKCADAYNIKLVEMTADKLSQYLSGTRGTVKSAAWSGSDFVVDEEPYSTAFPQFEIILDAAWVGVHWVLGKPEVTCPANFEAWSGETKNFDFVVKNGDSTENGAFGISLTCTGGSFGTNLNKVTLSPGQSQSISGYVTKSVTAEGSDSCTISVTTVRPSSRSASCSFSVKYKPKTFCIPNIDRTCSQDMKMLGICNAAGTAYDWTQCQQGCEYSQGSAQCKGFICKKENYECTNTSDCCVGLTCENKKCVKPDNTCKSCWAWLGGKMKPENACEPKVYAEAKWYNPLTWIYYLIPGSENSITQNLVCPIVLIFYGLAILAGGLIIALIVRVIVLTVRKNKGVKK